jgi:hypothetical protein
MNIIPSLEFLLFYRRPLFHQFPNLLSLFFSDHDGWFLELCEGFSYQIVVVNALPHLVNGRFEIMKTSQLGADQLLHKFPLIF